MVASDLIVRVVIGVASAWVVVHRIVIHWKRPKPSNDYERKVYAAESLLVHGIFLAYGCVAALLVAPVLIMTSGLRYLFLAIGAVALGMVVLGSFRRKELEIRGGP